MVVVVGAGVVGLSCALALTERGQDVVVLERHRRAGLGASTHNSGVIHAGLYHPADSLKTQLCIEGRDRLKAFCRVHRIPHMETGKLVVATEAEEEPDLERLAENARRNGVEVEMVGPEFVRTREPHVRATRALWSPESGWIEAESYVKTLVREVERRGGHVLPSSEVLAVEADGQGVAIVTPLERISADAVVNAAGLYADEVAALCSGQPIQIYPCRGEYAQLTKAASALVNGLVYPVPHRSGGSLGLHLAKTSDDVVTLGPTARYQDSKTDLETARVPLEAFFAWAQRMLPDVKLSDLRMGDAGIRAKLHPPSAQFADFMIGRDVRQAWLTHAAGIDSPGLTASLAIGSRVAKVVCS